MFGNMSPGGQACVLVSPMWRLNIANVTALPSCLKATITIIALLILTVIITVATPSDVLTRLTNVRLHVWC